MNFKWRSSYREQTNRYIKKHFGSPNGITQMFPYMKTSFRIKGNPDVFDERATSKGNNEYHGVERLAKQYHAVHMHEEAAEMWLIAAAWRREINMLADKTDERHEDAVEFAIKNYRYNRGMMPQKTRRFGFPKPQKYGLTEDGLETKDKMALREIHAAYVRNGVKPPFELDDCCAVAQVRHARHGFAIHRANQAIFPAFQTLSV